MKRIQVHPLVQRWVNMVLTLWNSVKLLMLKRRIWKKGCQSLLLSLFIMIKVSPSLLKTPPASILLKKAAGIPKGSGVPHTDKVGKVNRAQLEEIATTKMPDLTAADMDAAVRTIAGSARSMGIETEGVK